MAVELPRHSFRSLSWPSGQQSIAGLAARPPLEHATAVIESASAHGELVSVQLYDHPWIAGEYWPMITPCFQVHAVDDAGAEHEGCPATGKAPPSNEGSGGFWLWPPIDLACKTLRVTVSTLREADWAEIELPRCLLHTVAANMYKG